MNSERKTERLRTVDLFRSGGMGMFRKSRSPATVINVVGSIDQTTSPHLGRKLRGLIEGGERLVLIDMSNVEHIDSSAIATLLDCLHHLWRRGGQMAIYGARPGIRAWFEVFMLDGVLRLCEDEQQALDVCLTGRKRAPGAAPSTH